MSSNDIAVKHTDLGTLKNLFPGVYLPPLPTYLARAARMASKYAFGSALKELRFHLCSSGSGSEATRSFIKRAYPTMKKHNPETPILIREATGVEPKVWARYGLGKERMEPLNGLTDKEIEEKVTTMVHWS